MTRRVTGSSPVAARRLFVAVDPPPEAVSHLGAVVDTLAVSGRTPRADPPVSRPRPVARHAGVPRRRAGGAGREASGAMSRAAGAVIGRSRAGGGGSAEVGSRSSGPASAATSARSVRVAAMPSRAIRRSHLPLDDKPSRPHLTIARPGARVEPDLIAADVATLASYAGPEWMADTVHLVASELGPQPVHTRVTSSRLGSSCGDRDRAVGSSTPASSTAGSIRHARSCSHATRGRPQASSS